MYRIWMREKGTTDLSNLIYSPDLVNEGYVVLNPKLVQEVNKVDQFEFLIPESNPNYANIKKLSTDILLYDDDDFLFRGRVLSHRKDWLKRKKMSCEGELGFLNDGVVRSYEYSGSVEGYFQQLLQRHNATTSRRILAGNVTVTDPNDYIVRSSTQYPTTLEEMNKKLINSSLGGYFRLRRGNTDISTPYLDYLESFNSVSDQVIEFGKNLLDIDDFRDMKDVFTVILPLGKDNLTIESVMGDQADYIENVNGTMEYGYITKVVRWEDITEAQNLFTKAQSYLASSLEAETSIKMKAVDMHLLDVDESRIKIGDSVRVVSVPHGIDDYYMCSKIILDLQNPDKSEYTFGKTYKTMTQQMIEG